MQAWHVLVKVVDWRFQGAIFIDSIDLIGVE